MNLRRTAGPDPWSNGGSILMGPPEPLDLGSVVVGDGLEPVALVLGY